MIEPDRVYNHDMLSQAGTPFYRCGERRKIFCNGTETAEDERRVLRLI